MQEQPLANSLASSVKMNNSIVSGGKGKKIATGLIILVVIVAVILFLPYKGLPNLLGISNVNANSPYQNVNSIQQLSYAAEKASNGSGPFNMSYSFILRLKATKGPINVLFSLPINGFIAHYAPISEEKTDIPINSFVKQISSLSNSSILPYVPSALNVLNISVISNSTGGDICVPFLTFAEIANQSIQTVGFIFNDTSITNSSLLCLPVKTNNTVYNYTSLLNSSPFLNLNSSNLSALNGSFNVKFEKNMVYNGNSCSLIDINTTSSFEKDYNTSFGFALCFSNTYGVALYGGFTLNLTKDAGMISSLLNSSSNRVSFSSLIITGSLSSSFEKPPVSPSTISTLPVGSYFINSSEIAALIDALYPITIDSKP